MAGPGRAGITLLIGVWNWDALCYENEGHIMSLITHSNHTISDLNSEVPNERVYFGMDGGRRSTGKLMTLPNP